MPYRLIRQEDTILLAYPSMPSQSTDVQTCSDMLLSSGPVRLQRPLIHPRRSDITLILPPLALPCHRPRRWTTFLR